MNYIRRFYQGRDIWLVYGVMRDKAVDEMTSLLFPLASRIILTAPANSRAMQPERIPARDALVTHRSAKPCSCSERPRQKTSSLLAVPCSSSGKPVSCSYNEAEMSFLRAILITDPIVVLATILYGALPMCSPF